MTYQTKIESLKEQIMYQREIGCHNLADLLAEDLDKHNREVHPTST